MSAFQSLRRVFHWWGGGTASFLTYAHFSHDLSIALLVPLLPLIREGLGLSYLQSGLLLSAFTIAYGFSQIPMGWLADKTSRRAIILIGLLGVGLTTVNVGLSSAFYPMLFIFVIMGIFGGAYHPSAISMLSGYFEPERRGSILGFHMLGGNMGFTMAPILGGLIADMLGWRAAFIILGIPALVAALLVLKKFKLKRRTGNIGSLSQASTSSSASGKAIFRLTSLGKALRPIAIICSLAILMNLTADTAVAFIPLYLVDKHGISAAYAAMWIGVIRGGGMAGSVFGGWLSDRWNRKNTLFLAIILAGPVLYLLNTLPFDATLIVVFVIFGILMNMRQTVIQPLLLDTIAPQAGATAIGAYFFLNQEGISLLQPIAGHFMDIWGIVRVFDLIALASVTLSVMALFWAIRSRLR